MTVRYDSTPIFVIGRQHSGNTLLTRILGKHPELLTMHGEESLLEETPSLAAEPLEACIQRLVEGFHKASSFKFTENQRWDLHDHLHGKWKEDPSLDSWKDLYRRGEQWLLQHFGKRRRVQKATSYIFYTDRILDLYRDVKIVYLMRNPFDIAASMNRRETPEKILRMIFGWNRGSRKATRCSQEIPDRFLLLRFEELIESPGQALTDLEEFLALELREDFLDVALVNPAENPYDTEGPSIGLQEDKVRYYPEVLSRSQIKAVELFLDTEILERYYPDLIPGGAEGMAVPWDQLKWAFAGFLSLAKDSVIRGWNNPRAIIDRIKRRLWNP